MYGINDSPNPQPPVHLNCKCQIQPLNAIKAGDATKDGQNGADWYLKNKGQLPSYYIDDIGLSKLGWRPGDKPSKYAPGKMFTKGVYDNSDKHLPDKPGRVWYEADINYTPGKRNKHRVLWSNDGLIFVILASIPKCPIDFEIKFCQTRSKPQDGVRMFSGHLCEAEAPTEPTGETMSPVENLQRRMTIF